MGKVQETIAKIYIGYMCVVFCLFYHNNYIDMMQAKRLAFLFGGILYVLLACALELLKFLIGDTGGQSRKKRKNQHSRNTAPKIRAPRPGSAAKFLILLLMSWLMSFAVSIDRQEAFWGQGAKCTGLLLYAVGALSAYFLWKYASWTPVLSWVFLGVTVIVCQLQILNRWGIDPLGMYSNLVEEQKIVFISTIGQVNYNASLDCFLIAVLLVMFLLCKERFSQIIYAVTLVIAYAGAICCCSDSFYLALAAMFVLLLCYVYAHPDKWIRLAVELLLLDAAVFGIWFFWSFVRNTYFWGVSVLLFNMKLHWALTGTLWVILISGYLFSTRWRRLWKWYCAVLSAAIPLTVVMVIRSSLEGWQIADATGGGESRLEIWRRVWRAFLDAPLVHKLWGYGFNNVNQALALSGANLLGTDELVDAHNIFLNSLLTSGVVGTVLAFAFLLWLFVDSIRTMKEKETALLAAMIVLAYAAQGMLNGPQVLTEPVYLVGIGIAAGIVRPRQLSEPAN
jgi:O-antigen ligase